MGPGRFIATCDETRIPLAGDASGEGRSGFLSVDPAGRSVDFARMSPLGKLRRGERVSSDFNGPVLAAVCAGFAGGTGVDTAALLADGTVQVAYGMTPGSRGYEHIGVAVKLPAALMPKAPVQAVAADFDGDAKPDILLRGADGRLLLLQNARDDSGSPAFKTIAVEGARPWGKRIAVGDIEGDGKAQVVWLDPKGRVRRAPLEWQKDGTVRLGKEIEVAQAAGDDGLVVGRFRGAKQADIVVGQRLLPGGDGAKAISLPDLPDAAHARDDAAWIAADCNGDGKDDILRVKRNHDRFDGDHVYLFYAHNATDKPAQQFGDADNDGLPDAWETGEIKPAGLDLKAMGCSPNHADVIVEVQRFADVPEANVVADMAKAVKYMASLPVQNPDGVPGIALHVIFREPMPVSDSNLGWPELAAKYHPARHRGITHWMEIYNGGGGQSSMMDADGSCGWHGMPAVFLHEFGHQLGLDHSGGWGPSSIPTYPSLMNYAYNYQLNGKAEDVGYSDGRLSSVVLNEEHLDEYLPLTPDKIAFLAGPPYHYRMKAAPDGKGTLIDWNWNGIFGEKDVAADINYGYSTDAGERRVVAKSYIAPTVCDYPQGRKSEKLLFFYGKLPPGANLPAVEPGAAGASLSATLPGALCLRVWAGNDPRIEGQKWSDETVVDPAGVTAEASAAFFDKAVWIAYPTLTGLALRRITLDDHGKPIVEPLQKMPETYLPNRAPVQPTLTTLDGRLVLFLWRDARTPVGMRWITLDGGQANFGPETALDFTSNAPIGAAEGRDSADKPALWIGLTQDKAANLTSRWQVRCLSLADDKKTLHQTEQSWADGDRRAGNGADRVTLLWERDRAFGPVGRWYFLERGRGDLGQSCIGMSIADTTVNGGVLSRRYYDEWTNSRSAPGACWFRGDIILAMRWFGNSSAYKNDDTFVGFFGRGIEPDRMGDFDDLHEIRDYGLIGSIPTVNE